MKRPYAAVVVLLTSIAACATTERPADTMSAPASGAQRTPVPAADAEAFAEFSRRLEAYVALHNRVEATLPKRPVDASPEVIDKHQRAVGDLIRKERQSAVRGDIFTAASEKAFKAVLHRVFGGPDGKQLKASIMDENPGEVKLAINARYPDEVPLSTVPPQVLAALPKLAPDVEYRFIGDRLILLDVHAHIVVDYIDGALPK